MTTQRMQLSSAAEPSVVAAGVRSTLARLGRSVWNALEEYGRQRAARTIFELAERREATEPDVARQLRTAGRWLTAARHPGASVPAQTGESYDDLSRESRKHPDR